MKNMRRFIFAILAALPCAASLSAQNSLTDNIRQENGNYYNPAVSGLEHSDFKRSASFYAKHKFVDTGSDAWEKPGNYMFDAVGKTANGLYSAGYLYDGYSFYDRHSLWGGYGHGISLAGAGSLTLGARLVLNYDDMKWDEFYTGKPEGANKAYLRPDFDLGVRYAFKGLVVGLSAKNMLGARVKIGDVELTGNHNDWYADLSYTFTVSKFRLTPYLFGYMHRKTGIDAGLNFGMKDRFDVSYAFRLKELRSIFSARVYVYGGWHLGAAIDTGGLYSDNNLDLLAGYAF